MAFEYRIVKTTEIKQLLTGIFKKTTTELKFKIKKVCCYSKTEQQIFCYSQREKIQKKLIILNEKISATINNVK